MLFNSIEFLFIFLPIVFCINFILIKLKLIKYTNLWLLIASLYFYAYYKIEYLHIIVSSILFNYFIGLLIQKNNEQLIKKIFVILSVIGNLSLLCYYKYFNFIIETINNFSFTHFDTMKLFLPLGISFFTFQQIGYISDLYKGEAKHSNIIDYALFVCFFPQLIAGPICTFKELIPQFIDETKKCINRENILMGLFFITVGLFKKTVLADNFSNFIQNTMLFDEFKDFFVTWTFSLSVTLQGYFDFSGYCDIAIGLAMLFNITLPINFDSPYKSLDISDFWRRWHITMGRFLKYHVYIPMGGSRRGTIRTYWNLFFVFFITGVWHGANWPCIGYGIVNGILVCINKLWKKTNIYLPDFVCVLLTFITLTFISPLLRITDIRQFFETSKTMLGINASFFPASIENFNFVFHNSDLKLNIILFIASFIIVFCFKNSNELAPKFVKSNNLIYTIILAIVFLISVLSITKGSEFIYFNF